MGIPPPDDIRSQEKPLNEKEFIHEGYRKNPSTFWFWLCLLAIIAALLWGGRDWYFGFMEKQISKDPFLQVTNRQFSLFLWQFPEYMRVNAAQKTGYLTGFQYTNKVTMELAATEQYVVAPPEVLFLYHTWHRLLGDVYLPRPIPMNDFQTFLVYTEEWQPSHWPNAPQEYVNFVVELPYSKVKDLQTLPLTTLPMEVRQAFQGWTNFFKEGAQINHVTATFAQMESLLLVAPHYARNYWRNIVMKTTPKYLITLSLGKFDKAASIPNDEMAPFLKVAFYNFNHSTAQKEK